MSSPLYIESSQYRCPEDHLETNYEAETFFPDIHCNLVSFLALVQRFNFDFVPVIWNALEAIHGGATANVHEATIDIARKLAFKRASLLFAKDRTKAFRALISEVFILGNPAIRCHPNIVDLEGICWEIDEAENLNPVLVFQKAQRGSLDKYLKSVEGRESSFNVRQKLCLDIGNAIAGLHSANIVHGDIKPQNVLVFCDDDGHLMAKMIDFGYSCPESTEESTVRLPRSWPWYAPECVLDSCFTLRDAKKTDVYSFGMLCLYTLFRNRFGEDSAGHSDQENSPESKLNEWKTFHDGIISKVNEVLHQAIELSETLRSSLQAFFQSTLSCHPESRNTDFKTLMTYLSESTSTTIHWLPDTPTSNLDLSVHANFQVAKSVLPLSDFDYRVRRQIKASLQAMASAHPVDGEHGCTTCQSNAAFQLAFCYRFGFGVDPDRYEASRWLRAAEDMHVLEREIELVRQTTQTTYSSNILQDLRSVGNLTALDLPLQYLTQKGLEEIASWYKREIANMEDSLGDVHPVVLALKSTLVQCFLQYGDFQNAEKTTKEQVEIIKKIFQPDHPTTLNWIGSLASIYRRQGHWQDAEGLEMKVMEMKRRVLGEEHPSTLTTMSNLASTFWNQGRWREAEELEVKVMEIRNKTLGHEHEYILISMGNLASTYANQGRWKEAEELDRKVVETGLRVLGQEHPFTLTSMSNLASIYVRQGRWKEAEELFVKVMETSLMVLSPDHPDTLASMANLASTFWNQGWWKKAEELEVRVMKTSLRVLGQEHPDTLASTANLASTYRKQGRWSQAEELELRIVETRKRVLGPEHPDTLASMSSLASIFWDQGRWKEAEEIDVKVMDTRKRVLGQEHPDTLTSMANLASTYRSQSRWKEAQELAVKVMETRKRVLGQEHPDTLTNMASLSATFWDEGRWEEAEELDVKVMETRKRVLGEEHPDTLTSMANLASTYRKQERWKEAEELDTKVMDTRKRVLGREHPSTLTSMANLASIFWSRGQWKEAEELEVEVMETRERVLGQEHPDTLTSMANIAHTWKSQGRTREAVMTMEKVQALRFRQLGEDHSDTQSSLRALNLWREEAEADV